MLQFFKKTGRKRDIVRSPSLNIRREKYSNDVTNDLIGGELSSCTASDEDILLAIDKQIENESPNVSEAIITKNILRIVTDKNCLCYFVQYLEQRSSLPLIKFWLDAESYKSSVEMCLNRQTENVSKNPKSDHRRTNSYGGGGCAQKSPLGKSISFDCGINTSHNGFGDDAKSFDHFDDDKKSQNDHQCLVTDGTTTIRDSGDGSSDANSMTNLSDICEVDGEIEDFQSKPMTSKEENLVSDDIVKNTEETEGGRKSAIGASSDDCKYADVCHQNESEKSTKFSSNFQASLIMDAMRIFRKYLLNSDSVNYVDVPATILSRISLALCVQNDGKTIRNNNDGDCVAMSTEKLIISDESISLTTSKNIGSIFDEAQSYILDYLDTSFTNAFLESSFYCRYCVETLSGDNLKITDILYNEAALFYFMEFLENENKRQYSDFWLAAMNFKRQLDDTCMTTSISTLSDDNISLTDSLVDSQQAQNDALILYEKYFSLQATCPLHLSDRVRYQIEEKICSIDGGASIAHCFDLPLAIIERFLEQKYLMAFVKSPLFFKYLSELLQKIDCNKAQEIKRRASLNSISTKEPTSVTSKDYANTISSQNTLLAMESTKKRPPSHRIRSTSTSDMCIDSRQLRDPDLLWRRNSLAGLNFGRVDALGRYERDYDMLPFGERHNSTINGAIGITGNSVTSSMDSGLVALQNTGNKIKQAVRKLVHLPEDKIQEEIAWQVAEMIVKDITNVTLHSNDVQKET